MVIKHHLSSFFLAIIILLLTLPLMARANSFWEYSTLSDIEDGDLHQFLLGYLHVVRPEYVYYAHSHDDGGYFPQERENKILENIRKNFLRRFGRVSIFDAATKPKEANLLYYTASVPIAKLLLRYRAEPFDIVERTSDPAVQKTGSLNRFYEVDTTLPLIGATIQTNRLAHGLRKINNQTDHNKRLIYDAESPHNHHDLGSDLPTNNAIALAKLYLALGVDIHATTTVNGRDKEEKLDAVKASLFEIYDENIGDVYKEVGNQHRADDLMAPYGTTVHFYRSPVTYWLEEFIAADYPASMLDTHKLHYPHFMKDASVAQVTAMIQKSYSYKIPANINCPYKETCPLVPSVNMRDAMGRTPLHIAGEQGNKAVFDALITIGADSTIKDYRGNVPKL